MSVWRRSRPPEKRSGLMPMSYQPWGMGSGYADVAITDLTAMQKVAIWSARDLIASLVSEMPLDILRRGTTEQVPTPDYLEDPGGEGHGRQDWLWQLLQAWLGGGNNFARVLKRDPRGGWPTLADLLPPDEVSGWLADDGTVKWSLRGHEIPRSEMWHMRVYPRSGYVMGLSPIEHHITTIGQGISAGRYGRRFFTDNAIPQAIIRNTEEDIDQPKAKTIKARWMAALHNTREPMVWGKGWEYQQIQIKPDESQFLETQRYTGAECARIYGPGVAELLGYSDKESMTYSNVVDRRADFLVLSGNKWVNRAERALNMMLPPNLHARLNRAALLQSTTLDRYKAYQMALAGQFMTPNEARKFEDWAPLTGGDTVIDLPTAGLKAKGEDK